VLRSLDLAEVELFKCFDNQRNLAPESRDGCRLFDYGGLVSIYCAFNVSPLALPAVILLIKNTGESAIGRFVEEKRSCRFHYVSHRKRGSNSGGERHAFKMHWND
jgi:hypothetical protein